MSLMSKTIEVIEPIVNGIEVFSGTQMPFANDGGLVATISKVFSHCGLGTRKPVLRTALNVWHHVEIISEAMLIASSHQSRSRWATDRRGDVAGGETNSVRGDRIDVRSGDFVVPLATKFSVAEVIGEEHDDVGFSPIFFSKENRGSESQQQELDEY